MFHMAQRRKGHIPTKEHINGWIKYEPLNTSTIYALPETDEHSFITIQPRVPEDWVSIPLVESKICSWYEGNMINMHEVVIKDMSFRMLFLDFQKEVLWCLELSPSHLPPNYMAFVRSFELMCEYCNALDFRSKTLRLIQFILKKKLLLFLLLIINS